MMASTNRRQVTLLYIITLSLFVLSLLSSLLPTAHAKKNKLPTAKQHTEKKQPAKYGHAHKLNSGGTTTSEISHDNNTDYADGNNTNDEPALLFGTELSSQEQQQPSLPPFIFINDETEKTTTTTSSINNSTTVTTKIRTPDFILTLSFTPSSTKKTTIPSINLIQHHVHQFLNNEFLSRYFDYENNSDGGYAYSKMVLHPTLIRARDDRRRRRRLNNKQQQRRMTIAFHGYVIFEQSFSSKSSTSDFNKKQPPQVQDVTNLVTKSLGGSKQMELLNMFHVSEEENGVLNDVDGLEVTIMSDSDDGKDAGEVRMGDGDGTYDFYFNDDELSLTIGSSEMNDEDNNVNAIRSEEEALKDDKVNKAGVTFLTVVMLILTIFVVGLLLTGRTRSRRKNRPVDVVEEEDNIENEDSTSCSISNRGTTIPITRRARLFPPSLLFKRKQQSLSSQQQQQQQQNYDDDCSINAKIDIDNMTDDNSLESNDDFKEEEIVFDKSCYRYMLPDDDAEDYFNNKKRNKTIRFGEVTSFTDKPALVVPTKVNLDLPLFQMIDNRVEIPLPEQQQQQQHQSSIPADDVPEQQHADDDNEEKEEYYERENPFDSVMIDELSRDIMAGMIPSRRRVKQKKQQQQQQKQDNDINPFDTFDINHQNHNIINNDDNNDDNNNDDESNKDSNNTLNINQRCLEMSHEESHIKWDYNCQKNKNSTSSGNSSDDDDTQTNKSSSSSLSSLSFEVKSLDDVIEKTMNSIREMDNEEKMIL